MKCPCKECISLAVCYQQNVIKCEDLYDFICMTHPLGGFVGYKDGVAEEIYNLYNKYIVNTDYQKWAVLLGKNTDPLNHKHPFHETRLYQYKNDWEKYNISYEE